MITIKLFLYFFIISFSTNGFLANFKASEINNYENKTQITGESKKITFSSQYLLGPGDILSFEFLGLPLFNDVQEINIDGDVILKELNRINISGLTLEETEKKLNSYYKEFIYNPNIKVNIVAYRPFKVYVRGEVRKPGLYTFPGMNLFVQKNQKNKTVKRATVFDLLKLAEGVTNYADLKNITLIRENPLSQGGGKIKTNLDLLTMFIDGDQSQNIQLNDKDNILIKKSSMLIKDQILTVNNSNLTPDLMTVFVTGNVVNQGPLKIAKGSSLLQALASSGGKKLLTGNIDFLRFNDDGSTNSYSFRYNPRADVNSKQNPILMAGDVINVQTTLLGKTTQILGELASPIVAGVGLLEIFGD